jgi:hypothetical protein
MGYVAVNASILQNAGAGHKEGKHSPLPPKTGGSA